MLLSEKIAIQLKYIKHNTFCNANKAGRWLAYLLRKKRAQNTIHKIVDKGREVCSQEAIKRIFHDYYSKLYAKDDISSSEVREYLQGIQVPKLTHEQREGLNRLITSEEIVQAIAQLKAGKAPGTDGLTAIYYKTLQMEMVEPLKELFRKVQLEGIIPPSWKTAFISLIPKESQEPHPKNYRPISLLNTDYKIFTKILANRLMPVIQQIIHTDQTGFINGRFMKHNVRHILNLIEYLEKNSHVPAALIFLDAEKAFDKLNWQFLIEVMGKMDVGAYFSQAVGAIYQEQTARLIINGSLSDQCRIEKGTRQGCPLSPLIFVLTLEILLNQIRQSKEILGLKIRQQDYRLRAFADDLVLTITKPSYSIKGLLHIISIYGKVSGFKVNISKTKMMVKNVSKEQTEYLRQVSGFEIVNKVKYLGVYLTVSNAKLYKNNYVILWRKIQQEMESWKKLKLSLLGRIAAVKMNVLPRFLFLFQMIPVIKKEVTIEEWQKGINKFIWEGKKPRVKMKIIQDARERGGLKMPNLKLYYDATVLTVISDWINMSEERILNLEGYDLLFGWHAYLVYDKKLDFAFRTHLGRCALIRVWKKYQYKLKQKIPEWTIPRHRIENISVLQQHDVFTYKQLLEWDGNDWRLKSLERMKEERIIQTWFQYVQLQSRFREDSKIGIEVIRDGLIDQIKDQGRYHIKRIYNSLIELDSAPELVKDCMIKWAQNIQESIMLETWEKIWVTNVKFTQAQNLRENFYKMFYRWHLDPEKLSRMYPNYNPKCWRCECPNATYFHIWWSCKKIKAFWIKIWWIMQKKIFKRRIKFTPQLFLLGITLDCTVVETKLILNLVTAARLLIAQYWKREEICTVDEWIFKVANLAEMAKISAYLKDHTHDKYISEWKYWIDFIHERYQSDKLCLGFG